MSFSLQWRTALEAPSQALAFYRRHLVLIAGISLVPGAQRFVSVLTDPPGPFPVLLEVVTVLARVLLIGLIVRLAFWREGTVDTGRPGLFLRERWPSLALQAAVLAALVAFFNRVQGLGENLHTAVVLLVMNPTVIAFTFVWTVLAARQIVAYVPAEPAGPARNA
ncbi:hypothetical protein [Actinomadura sp. 21ATH]|uniref:hypothetical protein n=1 Tax=Actinomadura sp. 21ATH TaxID=1735444 RepID=UPI0035C16F4B